MKMVDDFAGFFGSILGRTFFRSTGFKRSLSIVLFIAGTMLPSLQLYQADILEAAKILGVWGLGHAGIAKLIDFLRSRIDNE